MVNYATNLDFCNANLFFFFLKGQLLKRETRRRLSLSISPGHFTPLFPALFTKTSLGCFLHLGLFLSTSKCLPFCNMKTKLANWTHFPQYFVCSSMTYSIFKISCRCPWGGHFASRLYSEYSMPPFEDMEQWFPKCWLQANRSSRNLVPADRQSLWHCLRHAFSGMRRMGPRFKQLSVILVCDEIYNLLVSRIIVWATKILSYTACKIGFRRCESKGKEKKNLI